VNVFTVAEACEKSHFDEKHGGYSKENTNNRIVWLISINNEFCCFDVCLSVLYKALKNPKFIHNHREFIDV